MADESAAQASQPVRRAEGSLRRWLVGANAFVTVLLLAVMLLLVNFLGSRRYVVKDMTPTKITELSPKTKELLGTLKEPVEVVVFYQQSHRLFELIHDLLERYAMHSGQLKIEYIDPEQDLARAKQIVQKHQINLEKDPLNQIIVSAAGRNKFLSDSDLAEYDYSPGQFGNPPTLKAFKGEDALTSAIMNVSQASQPKVWFITGHGEKELEGPGAELKKYLERENMKVESQTLLDKRQIPADVNAVVIFGPSRRYAEREILLLHAYLDAGGRLLAMIDPAVSSGLDDFLSRWGAQLGQDVVVDPARQLPFVSAANVFIVSYTEHPIVKHMQTLMTLFPLARSVKTTPGDQRMSAAELAVTSEQGWGETTLTSEEFRKEPNDTQGPVPVAVAAARLEPKGPRMVVIGDSDFASDEQIGNVGNRDLILGVFHWLVGQEQLIGIGPKPITSLRLSLTAAQLKRIFWLGFLGLPCVFGLVGLGVWWTRRT